MKKILLLFLLSFLFTVNAQSNDTVFIKKNKSQRVYILQDRNSNEYNSLIDFSNFNTNVKTSELESLGMNSKWLPVYKYSGNYYLYIPCDVINDRKYLITDNNIQIQSSEVTSYVINSIKKEQKNVFINYTEPNSKENFSLKISPVDKNNGIYKFITTNKQLSYEIIMLDANKYKNYNVVINDCTNNKVNEFEFDK
ncbi:hypothetical protein [Chryseobacterium ginsenosidimutans]|uniref:hypothetical protein n=1 Tax=Chryseobacterium ginsenosidimutans TaxID=687846 RepID=UPI0031D1681B